jgi:pimeloyl-ACP methyl ester carboxylesterase
MTFTLYQRAVVVLIVLGSASVALFPNRSLADDVSYLDPEPCSIGEKQQRDAFLRLPVPIPSGLASDDPAGKDVPAHHYVEMFDGKFVCGYSRGDFESVIAAYKAAFAHRRQDGKRIPLVLHFHGGLVSGESGFKAPAETPNMFWSTYTTGAFPVLFIWHSGPGEIGSREILPQTGHITTAHGLVNRWNYIYETAAERERDGTGHPDLTPAPNGTPFSERVNLREQQLREENLLNGANMWRHMEREIDQAMEPWDDRGGYLMVKSIAELAADPEFRVVLVGHSMGAIFASRLIETYHSYVAEHPELSPAAKAFHFDVVFMAPAVKYRVFDEALRTHRIGNFRMFTMYDLCERRDHVASGALGRTALRGLKDFYPRSLLYYVSSVTSEYPDIPLVGLDRFMVDPQFDGDVLIRSVKNRIERPRSLVFSPTKRNGGGAPGFEVNAVSHGAFDQDGAFLRSLGKIINKGFGGSPGPQIDHYQAYEKHNVNCDPVIEP